MPRMTVILDKKGKLVGALRTGPVQVGEDKLHVIARPHPDHVHHEIELDEKEMSQKLPQLRQTVLSKLKVKV